MGFCGPKLMTLVPLFANIATGNGVTFGRNLRLARHIGWYLDENASEEQVCQAVTDAAYVKSSLQM